MSSSTSAINKLIKEIIPDQPQIIVELGGGTGKITRKILDKMSCSGTLYCFEIQPHFIEELKKIEDKRFHLINDSAANILNHLEKNSVDVIVSTLPLSFFDKEERGKLLTDCYRALKLEGTYKQLSFLFFPRYFKGIFDDVITELKIIDMPPAVLYFCSKAYRE